MGGGTPIAYLTRRGQYSASHRLYTDQLSVEVNYQIYSKCANANGHGHNYYIEVTMRGPVDSVTGMVMNMNDLKEAMQKAIIEPLDHKFIDKDVPYFYGVISTSENVAIFAWNEIKKVLAKPELLFEVKLWETEKNIVLYRGETQDLQSQGKPVFLSQ